MKNQTIGLEIEMAGITREAVAQVIAEHFGTTTVYEGGAYNTYHVKDNTNRPGS